MQDLQDFFRVDWFVRRLCSDQIFIGKLLLIEHFSKQMDRLNSSVVAMPAFIFYGKVVERTSRSASIVIHCQCFGVACTLIHSFTAITAISFFLLRPSKEQDKTTKVLACHRRLLWTGPINSIIAIVPAGKSIFHFQLQAIDWTFGRRSPKLL